jgi:DinB superfamily
MKNLNVSLKSHSVSLAPDLGRRIATLESNKSRMLEYLDSLSPSARDFRPTKDDWSPLQVLEHIVMVEEWMSGPNQAVAPRLDKVRLSGYLFIFFGGRFMASGLRVPTLSMMHPKADLDFEEIKARWSRSREDLERKLQTVTAQELSRPIALHPVAGPLNPVQVLTLLEVHSDYHWRFMPGRLSGGVRA